MQMIRLNFCAFAFLTSQRKDDTAEALVKRLQGYHNETVPILEHYRPNGIVRTVNANQKMDGVWGEILAALQRGGK
jgi:adenylate kinase